MSVSKDEMRAAIYKNWACHKNRTRVDFQMFQAVFALIEHGPEVNEVSIELEVLKTERAGYEAENQIRLSSGEALAYGADAFQELAERMKGLNARVMVKEG